MQCGHKEIKYIYLNKMDVILGIIFYHINSILLHNVVKMFHTYQKSGLPSYFVNYLICYSVSR